MVLQPNIHKKATGRLTVMAMVMAVCMMFIASNLAAATYTVTGQVFAVNSWELDLKQKAADEAGIPLDHNTLVMGKFPFVQIEFYKKNTSELMGKGAAGINGQFNIVFTYAGGPPGPDVECRVYQVDGGGYELQTPVDGQVNIIENIGLWTTNKKLMVINDDILDVDDAASPTDIGVGLVFTRVGFVPTDKIEMTNNASSGGYGYIPSTALVPSYVPGKLKDKKLPFGGRLRIFGDFGPPKSTCVAAEVDYYQISIANLTDGTPAEVWKESFSKIKTSIIATSPLTITSSTEEMGPFTGDDSGTNVPGLYKVNRNTATTYYHFPDLRVFWNTSGQNGLFLVTVKYYRDLETGTATAPDVDEMEVGTCFSAATSYVGQLYVRVNNQPLDVSFDHLYLKDGTDYYMVGTDIYDFNNEGLCSMMNLRQPPRNYGVEVHYTAHHPGGYMDNYSLTVKSNDSTVNLTYIDSDYPASHPFLWVGGTVSGDSAIKPFGDFPKACAYTFYLNAWSRVTDGYNFIQHRHSQRSYYINPN